MEVLTLILENQDLIFPAIMGLLSSVVATATVISKLFPNETANKWIGYASKVIQFFAVHAKPTEVIKK